MQGDFSLNPLAYRDGVSRVLFQQGRVQLDSDANELTEALLRAIRAQTMDIIGAHGGLDSGFEIGFDAKNGGFTIGCGTYYVDGIRCLNWPDKELWEVLASGHLNDSIPYGNQPSYWPPVGEKWPFDDKESVLFYLDVFEKHVSSGEEDSYREVALLGPDTASRAIVVWQVKAMAVTDFASSVTSLGDDIPHPYDGAYVALNLMLQSEVRLLARARTGEIEDPCAIAPDAKYRGAGNRLYRVEIHQAGDSKTATFKYSADNASIVFPVREVADKTVHLESLGRDDRTRIRVNDWVEYVDDGVLLLGQANALRRVVEVRPIDATVVLSDVPTPAPSTHAGHRILRRWASDSQSVGEGNPLLLSDGIEVQFSRRPGGVLEAGYRTGDYWLIPARTASGDVIWPQGSVGGKLGPLPIPPHGVEHHYAPLALLTPQPKTKQAALKSYRRRFKPQADATEP